MAKNNIFVHFPFLRFPIQSKKRKNGIILGAFSVFLCFRFQSKTKKPKIEIYSTEVSIFPFLDQNRKIGKSKFVSLNSYFSISSQKW